MPRNHNRKNDELRPVKITRRYLKYAPASCLIEFGDTKVICSAILEDMVPLFVKGTGTGWLTAEYGMLPGSCPERIARNKTSGRTFEIQRLIGRSLRSVIDFQALGEKTIKVDCDVVQGDGGTRTAAITGSYVAVVDLLKNFQKQARIAPTLVKDMVAAVSVGIIAGELRLDLEFSEDSKADMDMNVVMRASGDFIEIQGTAEGSPFSRAQMNEAIDLAQRGIEELFDVQRQALSG
ncbi:MAG TPA: ribonuclease PH [Candidatus Omnitrophota bacterium]|nr:ribonuclease PH [Candidatus Omnitrophota bacterium]